MFMIDHTNLGWRYWFVTAIFLVIGVSGQAIGFQLAILLTELHLVHYLIRTRSVTAFSVQVRIAYLALLLVAFIEPLRWLYWIPTVGTWTMLLFGYCTMARVISLLPWNREEPLTLGLVKRTFFSVPVHGSIVEHRPNTA